MNPRPVQLDVYRLAIPMRGFDHAAARRKTAESVFVSIRYSDGYVGWGETLPRDYVTGETIETVLADLETLFKRCCDKGILDVAPGKLPQKVPAAIRRRCVNAAACALDIAGLRRFFHDLNNVDPQVLMALTNRARVRNYIDSHVSGVLGSTDPKKTLWRMRIMKFADIKDFKLKLGLGEEIDRQNLEIAYSQLRRGLLKGTHSLRVDVNGGWAKEDVPQKAAQLRKYGVCAVEQPCYCSAAELVEVARECKIPLMADESLLTLDDAQTLLAEPEKIWWNVRLSKNGGLLPVLELLELAQKNNVVVSLGCMVGETAILSAAQRRVLQLGPVPRFLEGNYGRYLLDDDIIPGRRSLMFGWAGSLRVLKGDGLGITPCPEKLKKYAKKIKTLTA